MEAKLFYLLGSIAALLYIYVNLQPKQPAEPKERIVMVRQPPLWHHRRRAFRSGNDNLWNKTLEQQKQILQLQQQVTALQTAEAEPEPTTV